MKLVRAGLFHAGEGALPYALVEVKITSSTVAPKCYWNNWRLAVAYIGNPQPQYVKGECDTDKEMVVNHDAHSRVNGPECEMVHWSTDKEFSNCGAGMELENVTGLEFRTAEKYFPVDSAGHVLPVPPEEE